MKIFFVTHFSGNKSIIFFDLKKASGPDCIPVLVLRKREHELSYILTEFFSMYLKESCFPACWKVSFVVSVFKNVGRGRCTAQDYHPVNLLQNVFKKMVNRIVDHLKKWGVFSDFQYGFGSSQSTTVLPIIVSNRIVRAFNGSGATRAVALNISTAFHRVWLDGLLCKSKFYGVSSRIFGLIPYFLSDRRLQVVLYGKSLKEYSVNVGVSEGSIGLTLCLLYINELSDDFISNITVYADDNLLYSKCDQASGLWKLLQLASELESDLQYI